MNAELFGILTAVIVFLGVGVACIAQSEEMQLILQTEETCTTIDPITSSTRIDIQYYCDVIPALCR